MKPAAVLVPPVRCLIVDEMHPSLLPLLTEIGVFGDYQPTITAANVPGVLAAGGYEGLIVRSKLYLSSEVIASVPHLRFVCRAGAGTDNLDEAALGAAGVHVINAPEGNRDAVGEFAVGLLLAMLRNIPRAHCEVQRGEWNREANRGIELADLTVGIVGFGHMGAAFAQKISGFGCRVLAHDLHPEKINRSLAQPVSLDELRAGAEVISLHVPLTDDTRRMVDAAWLAACPQLRWLLNTARGEIVETAAVVAALRRGQLVGAGLDVLENERFATLTSEQAGDLKFLQNHPNVVLTPHIGGWTMASYARINEVLVRKLSRYLRG
ncbi:MAG: phosphoglycerate dehydrogenase [Hymenobacteraceae bacterium]|nr:phosphoglycerate dehydrogenase [Hymenobacteraceae bacterium]